MELSRSQLVEQERRKLLLLKDEFLNDVTDFRHRHHIPSDGFGDNDKGTHYYSLMEDLADQYCDEQDKTRWQVVAKLERLGKKKESRDLAQRINDENPLNAMIQESRQLSEKYAVSGALEDRGLEDFLIYGDESSFVNSPFQTIISIYPAKNARKVQWVDIRIYKHTRQADIDKMWPKIQAWQKLMIGSGKQKSVLSNLLDRDIEIYKLRKSGVSSKEVAKKYSLTYNEVDDAYRNTREKIRKS